MTLYKIKHIPTGLYYTPSNFSNKSNLSKKGKLYSSKRKITETQLSVPPEYRSKSPIVKTIECRMGENVIKSYSSSGRRYIEVLPGDLIHEEYQILLNK